MAATKVVVVGSLVTDLVVWASRRPDPGETLIGSRFDSYLGGKGFNQAVAAARLGAGVSLVGCVGSDDAGKQFLAALDEEAIDATNVSAIEAHTGVGMPLVEDGGGVSIVGVPGANDSVTPDHVERAARDLGEADICILQCEIPAAASRRAVELAGNALIVLNAAPAGDRARTLMGLSDVLIVNEPELAELAGAEITPTTDPAHLGEFCNDLRRDSGAKFVVATLASRGAIAASEVGLMLVSAHSVDAIDATGAGDAFTASFALALSQGGEISDSLAAGNAAGALAASVAGARPSMPTRRAVESALKGARSPRPVSL